MILYNVTTKLEHSIHDEWLKWMQEEHIPDVMKTGMFVESKFSKLLFTDEEDGVTYTIQYMCKDLATLQQYEAHFAKALREAYKAKYGGKYVIFRSVMEVVATNEI